MRHQSLAALTLEQVSLETRVSQHFYDTFNMSCRGYLFEIVEEDYEESERHFGSTWVHCRCEEKRTNWCGEARCRIVLCSRGTEREKLVRTEYERFITHSKWEETKSEEDG